MTSRKRVCIVVINKWDLLGFLLLLLYSMVCVDDKSVTGLCGRLSGQYACNCVTGDKTMYFPTKNK